MTYTGQVRSDGAQVGGKVWSQMVMCDTIMEYLWPKEYV
jgi:hypothetical protein